MEEYEKQNAKGRIWRLLAVITVAMVFVVLIIASLTSRSEERRGRERVYVSV